MDVEFSVPKTKGTIQTLISDRGKSKHLSWYVGAAEQRAWVTGVCAKVPLTWRHILGLYRDIQWTFFFWSPADFVRLPTDSDKERSVYNFNGWFILTVWDRMTTKTSRKVQITFQKSYKLVCFLMSEISEIVRLSDNDDHRRLSFWSLVSSETGQNFNNWYPQFLNNETL